MDVTHFIENVPTDLVDQCVDMLIKYKMLPYLVGIGNKLFKKNKKEEAKDSS